MKKKLWQIQEQQTVVGVPSKTLDGGSPQTPWTGSEGALLSLWSGAGNHRTHSRHMPIHQGSMEPNLPSLRSSAPARFSNNHRLVAATALWLDRHPALRHGLAVPAGFLGGLEAKERAVLQGCYVATDWAHLDHPGRGRQMDAGGCSRNGEPESAAARLVQTIKSCGCFSSKM